MNGSTRVIEQPRSATRTRQEPRWRVVLHNDDVTTMEFVVQLLVSLFHKSEPDAVKLMLEVHHRGAAVVEWTHRERAELYVEQVRSLARARRFPLCATAEPE
ncbi:MAG: ATP-dependent Clp protease adaptor ClpS [Planctomycetes bacterium]|nr:ATP-dependent Clp protease adaptor ClpS [Planctomycetota bacterium]